MLERTNLDKRFQHDHNPSPSASSKDHQETAMLNKQQRYLSYLLRLWRSEADGPSSWRASLEDPHTGDRHNFASLEQLVAFLEEQIADSPRRDERPRSGDS